MSPVGFEPTISAGERPQTYALDRAATGTGILFVSSGYYVYHFHFVRTLHILTACVLVCVFRVL